MIFDFRFLISDLGFQILDFAKIPFKLLSILLLKRH